MLRIFLVIDDYNELIYLQSLLKKLGFDVEGLQNQKKYADVSLGFNPQILITTARGRKVDGLALSRSIAKRRGIPKVIALRSPGDSFSPSDFEDAGVDEVLDSPINPKKLLLCIATLGAVDEVVLLEKYVKIKANAMVTDEEAQLITVFDDNGQPSQDIQRVKAALETAHKQIVEGGDAAARFPLANANGTSEAVSDAVGVKEFSVTPTADRTSTDAKHDRDTPTESSALADEIGVGPARQLRFDKWIGEMGKLPVSYFDRSRILEFNRKIREQGSTEDIEEIESDRRDFVRALFKGKK